MLRILLHEVQLLDVCPGHALAAGDAVLQIDVVPVGFQIHGIQLTGIALGHRGKQAVLQLVAARLQIRRLRQEGKRQLHILMQRVVALLLFNAIDDQTDQPPFQSISLYGNAGVASSAARQRFNTFTFYGSYHAANASTA